MHNYIVNNCKFRPQIQLSFTFDLPLQYTGCHADLSTGSLTFTINGREVANKFKVEPGTALFPAVLCEATNKEILQIELGRTKVTRIYLYIYKNKRYMT